MGTGMGDRDMGLGGQGQGNRDMGIGVGDTMGTGEYGDGAMGMGDTLGMGTWGHVGGGDVGTGTWGRDTGTRWGLGVGVGRYGDPVGMCWGQELQKAMALFWGRTLCGPIGEMCGAVAASCSRQHQEGRGGGWGGL